VPFIGVLEAKRTAPQATNPQAKLRTSFSLLLVFLLLLSYFSYVALHRFVDGDEGFYLLASRLVLLGKRPYLDFSFVQAPFLPYFYALWLRFTGSTWISARLLAGLLTAILGTLIYDQVRRQTRCWWAALAAVLLFATSTLVFAWLPLVKTFSLAGLLLFAAYVLISRLSTASHTLAIFSSGLLFGCSVATRSYLLLLTPLFIWWLCRQSDTSARSKRILLFLAGMVVGNLLCIYLLLASPGAFLFNNLTYHSLRTGSGLVGWREQKLLILIALLFAGPHGNGVQAGLLFIVGGALVSSFLTNSSAGKFSFWIAIAIAIISLLPTPVDIQYFSLCIPFLVVSTVCAAYEVVVGLQGPRDRAIAAGACVAIALVYMIAGYGDFQHYMYTGYGVPGLRYVNDKSVWTLPNVAQSSAAIDSFVAPGEFVAAFWPGDLVQTRAYPLPGLENDFGLPIADKLTPEQKTRYHITSPGDLMDSFAAHKPRVVVVPKQLLTAVTAADHQKMQALGDELRNWLTSHGYKIVRDTGRTDIYACCEGPTKP
jgi:hypothetical protein